MFIVKKCGVIFIESILYYIVHPLTRLRGDGSYIEYGFALTQLKSVNVGHTNHRHDISWNDSTIIPGQHSISSRTVEF